MNFLVIINLSGPIAKVQYGDPVFSDGRDGIIESNTA
jgi:hypothetical protein